MTSDHVRPTPQPGLTPYRILTAVAIVLFAAGLGASLAHAPAEVAISLRWVALSLFLPVAWRRRSLLLWTFYFMLAGAELGADAPQFAAQTHFLGEISLRLIRMIVAPLIFGGIVTGIAGHGELRGVGRVALKSILYFEVVTTVGLILGLIAINVSHAGVGNVDGDETQDESDGGDNLEVEDGFEGDTAHAAQLAVACDAGDDAAEDERGDNHADKAEGDFAQEVGLRCELGCVGAEFGSGQHEVESPKQQGAPAPGNGEEEAEGYPAKGDRDLRRGVREAGPEACSKQHDS